MARDETEGMDGIVKKEVLRLLRNQIDDPYSFWVASGGKPQQEYVAAGLLKSAEYLSKNGKITLAGVDYYRREARPVRTWMRINWFPLTVAAITVGAAVLKPGVDFLWGIVLP